MRTHRNGSFPVSGTQGVGNWETASNPLISIGLMLPREVAIARTPGKQRQGRFAQGSGSTGQHLGVASRPLFSWYEDTVPIAERRTAVPTAGSGGSDIAVAI